MDCCGYTGEDKGDAGAVGTAEEGEIFPSNGVFSSIVGVDGIFFLGYGVFRKTRLDRRLLRALGVDTLGLGVVGIKGDEIVFLAEELWTGVVR